MPRYQFAKIARAHLLDEAVAAGLSPATPDGGATVEMDATTCWITCPPEQFATAATVVAAHDAAAIDAAAQALAQQDAGDLAGFRAVYAALVADAATLEDTTVALSAQQLRSRLAALERIVARLARYAGRRLG